MKETFPISLFLGSMALGTWPWRAASPSASSPRCYQNQSWDYVSVSVATLGVSVPNFVLAVFLIVLFSFVIPLFSDGRVGLAA